jgi:hypothetical protein
MNKSRLLGAAFSFLIGYCIAGVATAASISIGTYTFAGPEAFPTDATYVSGETVYIEHPPGTSWNAVAGNSTTDLVYLVINNVTYRFSRLPRISYARCGRNCFI